MKLIDYIVTVFVVVDDFCKIHYTPRKLRQRGPIPKLADSEAITMEIIGEYLGFDTDEDIYNYFCRHWHSLFPNMPDRSNFVRQCANLWNVKQHFFEHLSKPQDKYLQIVDSMPIEVCKFVRAEYPGSRILPVTLFRDFGVPIVVWIGGILKFDVFQPRIFARRLVKVTVYANIPLHLLSSSDSTDVKQNYEGLML